MKMYAIYAHNGDRLAHIPYVAGMRLIESGIAIKDDSNASDGFTITDYHQLNKSGFTIILQRDYVMREIESDDYD